MDKHFTDLDLDQFIKDNIQRIRKTCYQYPYYIKEEITVEDLKDWQGIY